MGYTNSLSKNIKASGQEKETAARLRKKYRHSFKDRPDENGRIVNTLEYAIAWGVKNKPYSRSQLYRMCSAPDAPAFPYLMHEFVTFERYYRALVKAGMEERPLWREQERSAELELQREKAEKLSFFTKSSDAAKMAAHYGIMGRKQYRKLRSENPEARKVLPPDATITKIYGSFKRFMVEVMKYNADIVITKYVELSHEIGKWLTLKECDEHSLPIRGIMDLLRPSVFNLLCYHKMRAMYPESN